MVGWDIQASHLDRVWQLFDSYACSSNANLNSEELPSSSSGTSAKHVTEKIRGAEQGCTTALPFKFKAASCPQEDLLSKANTAVTFSRETWH